MAVNLPPLGELAPVPGVRVAAHGAGIKQRVRVDRQRVRDDEHLGRDDEHLGRDDLAVVELARNTAVAGVFTQSAFRAPPVVLASERVRKGAVRALLINSGNANAATGAAGLEDASALCEHAAACLGGDFDGDSVLPFSTGVIGERLPLPAMRGAIERAARQLSPTAWAGVARAIMTTDTGPKGESRRMPVGGETVTVTGVAKGAGMIKPDMATMLAFLCCDARITTSALRSMTREVADKSFNRVTVDGDTSTNDCFVVCATGYAGHAEISGPGPAYEALRKGLDAVATALAERIVRDAEGSTRFVTVHVGGGASEAECLRVAYTLAESLLVKTAIFAGDPNWGRFCMAIGRAGVPDLDPNRVSLSLDDVTVARHGLLAEDYEESAAAAVMGRDEYGIHVDLGRGACSETVWTSDLSYEYVRINAEYRT